MWLFKDDGEQGVDMTNARPNGQDSSWLKLLCSGPQPSQGPVVLTSLLSTKFLLRTEINRFVFHVLPPLGDEFYWQGHEWQKAWVIDWAPVIQHLLREGTGEAQDPQWMVTGKKIKTPKQSPIAFSQAVHPLREENANSLNRGSAQTRASKWSSLPGLESNTKTLV